VPDSWRLSHSRGSDRNQAVALPRNKKLEKDVAAGLASYAIANKSVLYSARGLDSDYLNSDLRTMNLTPIKFINIRRLQKFFAQSEVDVLSNFPVPTSGAPKNYSININAFPYYDLRYYSKGKGRVHGFIKKVQIDDSELVRKLMAS
jgi:hypothetical protein